MSKKNPNKVDINQMTPEELDQYVKSLPQSTPPKWSSVGWLAGLAAAGTFTTVVKFSTGASTAWGILGLSILAWVGVGYLIYKILTFKPGG